METRGKIKEWDVREVGIGREGRLTEQKHEE